MMLWRCTVWNRLKKWMRCKRISDLSLPSSQTDISHSDSVKQTGLWGLCVTLEGVSARTTHRDGRLTPVTFQGKELRTQQYLIRHSVKVKAQEHVSSAPLDSVFLSLMNHLYERRPDSSGMRLSGGLNRHLVSRWTRPLSSGSSGHPLMRLPSHGNGSHDSVRASPASQPSCRC